MPESTGSFNYEIEVEYTKSIQFESVQDAEKKYFKIMTPGKDICG